MVVDVDAGGRADDSLTTRLTPVTPDRLESPSRRFVGALVVIVLVGAAIRLGYVWFDRRHADEVFNDGFYYHHGANLLADGHGFVNPFEWVLQGRSLQSADHPPLYLVYLAGFSAIGLRSTTSHLIGEHPARHRCRSRSPVSPVAASPENGSG